MDYLDLIVSYQKLLAPFFAKPDYLRQAVRADRALRMWEKHPSDRKLQKAFLGELYYLPIEF